MSTSTKPKRRARTPRTKPEAVNGPMKFTIHDADGREVGVYVKQRTAEKRAEVLRDKARDAGTPTSHEVRDASGEVVARVGYLDDPQEADVSTTPTHEPEPFDADGVARERDDAGKIIGYLTTDGERFDKLGEARKRASALAAAARASEDVTPIPKGGKRGKRGAKDADDGLTVEQRVARMAKEDLPPVPVPGPPETPKPSAPARRGSGLTRIKAGRERSRATAATYAVDYDPAKRFPNLADHVTGLVAAVKALDAQLDKASSDPAREHVLYDAISERTYAAWAAGLPTTAIGSIIGCSGGSARGRALTYALHNKLDAPTPIRSTRASAPSDPKDPSGSRYAEQLIDVFTEATAGDVSDDALVVAYAIAPTRAIADAAGLTPASVMRRVSAACERNGTTPPDADSRRKARAAMPVPALPTDD